MNSVLLWFGLLKTSGFLIFGADGQSGAGIVPSFDQQFPYVVSIQYNNPNSSVGKHCMGLIVTKRWVASSCFCLSEITINDPLQLSSPFRFRLIAGTKVNIPDTGIVRFPSQIFIHPKCDVAAKNFDFALMPVTYDFARADFESGRISAMPISSHDLGVINENFNKIMLLRPICQTVGWVDGGIDQSENLYIFDLELVPESECSQVICVMVPSLCKSGKGPPKAEDMGMICGKALGETPCTGMGGSPLICGTNVWGVASLLNKCGEKLVKFNYVIFTKISVAMSMVYTSLGNITLSGQSSVYIRPALLIVSMFSIAYAMPF